MTDSIQPPAYLSPSSMATFKQCPLKFRLSRIDLLPDEPSEATLLGNFVHEVLEDFYALDQSERTLAQAKLLSKSVWDEREWEQRVLPWISPSPDALRMFRWNAWWCIENLWKVENPESVSVHAIEYELDGELGGIRLRGFIDRFSLDDSTIIISDYKTGKVPNKKWASDKFLQLEIYASLSEQLEIGKCSSLELLYLKEGVKLQKDFTEKDKTNTIAYVQNTKSEVDACCESGIFPTSKSILCNWCAYKPICPAWTSV